MAAKKPYKIIHLSDLHLVPGTQIPRTEVSMPSRRLTGMNSYFRAILESDEIQQADTILITGDVTDKGDKASWRVFHRAVNSLVPDKQVLVVAGNHDVCDMNLKLDFRLLFESFTHAQQRRNLERLSDCLAMVGQEENYPWVKKLEDEHKRVMVIALDSNHSGHFSVADNAVGKIGDQQLDELKRVLKKHSDPQKPRNFVPVRIVAIHHSPNLPTYKTRVERGLVPKKGRFGALVGKAKGLATRWTHQIPELERRRLRDICAQYHVRLIVHGHMHEAMDRRVSGVRIIGAPASTQPLPGRGKKKFQFYEYTVRGEGGRVEPRLITLSI